MIKYYKQAEGGKVTGFCVFHQTKADHPKFPGESTYDAIFVQVFDDGADCTVTPGLITDEAIKPNNKYGKNPAEISKPEWLQITSRVVRFLENAEEYSAKPDTEYMSAPDPKGPEGVQGEVGHTGYATTSKQNTESTSHIS